jgi:hypothetical protein
MSNKIRFALGFILGLILSAVAFLLAGAGHGTYAPAVANASVLALLPVVGIFISLFGTPFLWAIYYVFIPQMDSQPQRIVALILLSLLHLVPGAWIAFGDSAFNRALNNHPAAIWLYGTILVITILFLAFLSALESRKKSQLSDSLIGGATSRT